MAVGPLLIYARERDGHWEASCAEIPGWKVTAGTWRALGDGVDLSLAVLARLDRPEWAGRRWLLSQVNIGLICSN